MEYVFGKNVIDSFLDSNLLVEVYVLNSFSDEKLLTNLRKKRIPVFVKNKEFFDKIEKSNKHQGIIGAIKQFGYSSLDAIVNDCNKKNNSLIVMLDGIEDPHNFGAIIRTCEAFSVDGIIIAKHNSCPLNATVAKVSTGTIANVKIAQVNNLTQTLKDLKNKGFWVYEAEANQGQEYTKLDYSNSKKVLVMGSEGFGISRLVKEQSDFNIYINMTGKVNSLNVSVATAILIAKMTQA